MKKSAVVRRPKFADEKYLGPEPTTSANTTKVELIKAYSWFNYFYDSNDAKGFALSYLKNIKYNRDIINKISKSDPQKLRNIGWNCRLAENGTLSDDIWKWTEDKIIEVTSEVGDWEETKEETKVVVSIQDRINTKASDLIGELEEQLDVFYKEGVITFNLKSWLTEKNIAPQIAKKIKTHFEPQFEEISGALAGETPDLTEAYAKWKKPILKVMVVFIKNIIDAMDAIDKNKLPPKPRKKKVKPASVIVAKLQYKKEEDALKSIPPTSIVDASQLWTYNTKYRKLTVFNAEGPGGLSVRGTSIIGFDPKTSTTKKLRKPEQTLEKVLKIGKVGLKKIMTDLTTAPSEASGRVNEDTILLRSV